jgi:hypothetical protein
MADPFWMLLTIHALGHGYVAWDKMSGIEFLAPGRGMACARFVPDEAALHDIRAATDVHGIALRCDISAWSVWTPRPSPRHFPSKSPPVGIPGHRAQRYALRVVRHLSSIVRQSSRRSIGCPSLFYQSFLIVAINLQVDALRGWMGPQLRESA